MGSRFSTWGARAVAPLGLVTMNAATVPLTLTGAASQSASLTEWRDSNANVLASISSDGGLVLQSTGGLALTGTGMIQAANNGLSFSGYSPITRNGATGALLWSLQNVAAASLSIIAGHASATPLIAQGAASHAADLFVAQDSAAHTQFAIMNKGSGGAPVWALRVRAVANSESMVQTHTAGSNLNKAIQVLDDSGASIGWINLTS